MKFRGSYRLKTLLYAVGVIGICLGVFCYAHRVPIKHGEITITVCYVKDWESLTGASPEAIRQNAGVFCFEVDQVSDLFRDFSVEPDISYSENLTGRAGEFMPKVPSAFNLGAFRVRQFDKPVGKFSHDFDRSTGVMDSYSLSGRLQESLVSPKRYTIACVVNYEVGDMPPEPTMKPTTFSEILKSGRGRTSSKSGRYNLFYNGTVTGNVIVFAKLIDNTLVHLTIVDLH